MLDEGILGLRQNPHKVVFREFLQCRHDRQTSDKLGDESEFDKVLRTRLSQKAGQTPLFGRDRRTILARESDFALARAFGNDLVQPDERAAANEEDVLGVHFYVFLIRVLTPALRRNAANRAFQDLQKRLLHALARNIARNGYVIRLGRDLVDLVHIDDAALRLRDVPVGILQKIAHEIFHILAHIPRLRQNRRVANGKGDAKHLRQRAGKKRLSGAGRTQHQDVGLLDIHAGQWIFPVFLFRGAFQTPIVVMDGYRQNLLRLVMPYDVLVEELLDFTRRRRGRQLL